MYKLLTLSFEYILDQISRIYRGREKTESRIIAVKDKKKPLNLRIIAGAAQRKKKRGQQMNFTTHSNEPGCN